MNKTFIGLFAGMIVALAQSAYAGPVDINSADARTLATELNGIGISRAKAIVAWRQKNGPFVSAKDLANVKGIGSKIIRMNQANILVGDPDKATD